MLRRTDRNHRFSRNCKWLRAFENKMLITRLCLPAVRVALFGLIRSQSSVVIPFVESAFRETRHASAAAVGKSSTGKTNFEQMYFCLLWWKNAFHVSYIMVGSSLKTRGRWWTESFQRLSA